ncbi:MAG: D-amino-acid transaminase [Rhodothalassiaceae bacterium]
MARIAYVNGRYRPLVKAAVPVEDRGLQFSDGVYEVALALNHRLLDLHRHLRRLDRSLAELELRWPMAKPAFCQMLERLVRLNRLSDAVVYWQVTRGTAPRDHAFPASPVPPGLIVTVRRFDLAAVAKRQRHGVAVATTADLRWKRCDIKSVSLLGNVLAKQHARANGQAEAWMTDSQGVTEGSSTTAWIVRGGSVQTRQLGADLLPGITREVVLERAGALVVEGAFTVEEAIAADEAFMTSSSNFVMPVTTIDGRCIGDGTPGPVTRALIAAHWDHVTAETGRVRPAG